MRSLLITKSANAECLNLTLLGLISGLLPDQLSVQFVRVCWFRLAHSGERQAIQSIAGLLLPGTLQLIEPMMVARHCQLMRGLRIKGGCAYSDVATDYSLCHRWGSLAVSSDEEDDKPCIFVESADFKIQDAIALFAAQVPRSSGMAAET